MNTQTRERLVRGIVAGILALAVGTWWVLDRAESRLEKQDARPRPAVLAEARPIIRPDPHPELTGKIERFIGKKGLDFGSTEQARALLGVLDEEPGHALYLVSFWREVGQCKLFETLAVDLANDALVRGERRECPGDVRADEQTEAWLYQARKRLEWGARGRLMNDLPGDRKEYYVHTP